MSNMDKINKNEKNKKKQNNKGSAIVLVIVVLALMGILVSVVLYMCMANFHMKANDLQSKDNFYSAEQILDEIRVGLQEEVSVAIDIAYMDVIQKYELRSSDPEERKKEFTILYVNKLRDALKDPGHVNSDGYYDIDKLKAYVQDQSIVLAANETIADHVGAQIEALTALDSNNNVVPQNIMVAYTDSLLLKNISVKYKDDKGYVSIITTDIRIAIPNISFESSLQIPEIIDYSLVANDQLVANSNTTISGCVYGGRDGIVADDLKSFYFKGSDVVITPDLVSTKNGKIVFDKDTDLWAGGTQVENGGTLNLLGNSYIQDDTTVMGNASTLEVGGKYMGLRSPQTNPERTYATSRAEDGSAIIINGTNSNVKLADVKRLLLPGNAYIGVNDAKDIITPAPSGTPTGTANIQTNGDVALGESLTAKASQLAYLVPSECIGYVRKDAASKYECVLGTNPVLYSDYEDKFLKADKDNRVEVDFSKAGIDYGTKYGASFRQKYVRTTNGNATNETLIYYYMTFNSQESASKFFYDYFSQNKERISQYLDIYVKTLEVGDIERLNVAGNILKKVPKKDAQGNQINGTDGKPEYTYELIKETKTADDASGIDKDYATELSVYNSVFEGLTTKLVRDAGSLTQEEKDNVDESNPTSAGIFANLIDMDMFQKLCNSPEFRNSHNEAQFINSVEGVKAVVVDNKGKGIYNISNLPETTSLLIASGDVTVNEEFKGCIICGGTITVSYGTGGNGNTEDVTNDKEMIRHVLNMTTPFTIETTLGTTETKDICVMDLFKDGMGLATSEESADKEDHIVVEDLVTYDNWNKE